MCNLISTFDQTSKNKNTVFANFVVFLTVRTMSLSKHTALLSSKFSFCFHLFQSLWPCTFISSVRLDHQCSKVFPPGQMHARLSGSEWNGSMCTIVSTVTENCIVFAFLSSFTPLTLFPRPLSSFWQILFVARWETSSMWQKRCRPTWWPSSSATSRRSRSSRRRTTSRWRWRWRRTSWSRRTLPWRRPPTSPSTMNNTLASSTLYQSKVHTHWSDIWSERINKEKNFPKMISYIPQNKYDALLTFD